MKNIKKGAGLLARISMIFMVVAFWANCTGKSNVSLLVDAKTGGTVSIPSANAGNGNTAMEASLSIPADALGQNVTVSVTRLSAPEAQSNIVPIQASYQFAPADLQFLKPATLNVCYDVQALVNAGLSENTVSLYYVDPDTGAYANIGGSVNTATHCVSAQVEHFSIYLPAASALTAVNTAPVVGNPTFLPNQPMAGIPLTFQTIISSFQTGQNGAIATAFLKYRIAGSGAAFTTLPLQPDYTDGAGQRYVASIPNADVTLAGIEYYIEATDNLNRTTRLPVGAPAAFNTRTVVRSIATVVAPAIPLRLNPVLANLDMAAGFSRDLTIQAQDDLGTWRNVLAGTVGVTGTMGSFIKTGPSIVRFTANTVGTGSINVTVGAYTVSQPVTVHPGNVNRIAFFDNAGVAVRAPIDVAAGWTYQFDVLGYDAFGNAILILPAFSTTNGIGTVNAAGLFVAGMTYPNSGTLDANLGGLLASVSINVITPPTVEMPLYSPVAGVYSGAQSVSIASATPGATVCYNFNAPAACDIAKTGCASGTMYTGTPINVDTSRTLESIACKPLYLDSAANTGIYTIMYTISGTASGITAPVVLKNNGGDFIFITANGTFNFPVQIASGSTFDVAVLNQPVGQNCTITNGSGTVTNANISNIMLSCQANQYLVGGTVSGLNGTLVLQNNGADDKQISANGTFFFATPVPYNGSYNVTVLSKPAGQNCTVTNGSGTVVNNVLNVSVSCYTPGFSLTGSMGIGRYYHTSTLLNDGKVLIAGGAGVGGPFFSAEIYDPQAGTFTATGNMTVTRDSHTATLLTDGRVLITGSQNGYTFQTAELYNPVTGTFNATGSMLNGRRNHTATRLTDGRVLITGGYASTTILSAAEIYNPATGTFSATGAMSSPRWEHSATLLRDGRVLIVGGYNSTGYTLSNTAEIYNPATGTFTVTGLLPAGWTSHSAVLLQDNVLIAGGNDGSAGGYTYNASVYNTATGSFISTGRMSTVRIYQRSTALLDGRALIVGGFGATYLTSAETYDPATGTFTLSGNMSAARMNHAVTLLTDGRVLVTGGSNPGGVLSSAEIYRP